MMSFLDLSPESETAAFSSMSSFATRLTTLRVSLKRKYSRVGICLIRSRTAEGRNCHMARKTVFHIAGSRTESALEWCVIVQAVVDGTGDTYNRLSYAELTSLLTLSKAPKR